MYLITLINLLIIFQKEMTLVIKKRIRYFYRKKYFLNKVINHKISQKLNKIIVQKTYYLKSNKIH